MIVDDKIMFAESVIHFQMFDIVFFFQMLRIRFISMGIIDDDDDDDDHSMGIQRDKTRHNEMVWSLKKTGTLGVTEAKWCDVM